MKYTQAEKLRDYASGNVIVEMWRLFRVTEEGKKHPLFNFVVYRDTQKEDKDGLPILSRRLYKKNLRDLQECLLNIEEEWEEILRNELDNE